MRVAIKHVVDDCARKGDRDRVALEPTQRPPVRFLLDKPSYPANGQGQDLRRLLNGPASLVDKRPGVPAALHA
jgi:hypothetical protein